MKTRKQLIAEINESAAAYLGQPGLTMAGLKNKTVQQLQDLAERYGNAAGHKAAAGLCYRMNDRGDKRGQAQSYQAMLYWENSPPLDICGTCGLFYGDANAIWHVRVIGLGCDCKTPRGCPACGKAWREIAGGYRICDNRALPHVWTADRLNPVQVAGGDYHATRLAIAVRDLEDRLAAVEEKAQAARDDLDLELRYQAANSD